MVVVGYKVTAKTSAGAIEAADRDPTKTRQSTLYSASAGFPLLIWTKIVVGLQLTSVVSA